MTDNNSNASHGKCEDCGYVGELSEEPACGDYHSASMCCNKFICLNGCKHFCKNCKKPNKIELFDGYGEVFKCYSCGEETTINCRWWGNSLMINCQRYCGCSLSSWDGVLIGKNWNEEIE